MEKQIDLIVYRGREYQGFRTKVTVETFHRRSKTIVTPFCTPIVAVCDEEIPCVKINSKLYILDKNCFGEYFVVVPESEDVSNLQPTLSDSSTK